MVSEVSQAPFLSAGITEVKEAPVPCNIHPGVRNQVVNRQTNKQTIR